MRTITKTKGRFWEPRSAYAQTGYWNLIKQSTDHNSYRLGHLIDNYPDISLGNAYGYDPYVDGPVSGRDTWEYLYGFPPKYHAICPVVHYRRNSIPTQLQLISGPLTPDLGNRYKGQLTEMAAVSVWSSKELEFESYPQLAGYQRFKNLFIDTRQPFSSEDLYNSGNFSIWFPVVNIFLLPALIGQVKDLLARTLVTHGRNIKTSADLANAHLMTQFGLLPLVKDFNEALSALRSFREWVASTVSGITPGRRFRHGKRLFIIKDGKPVEVPSLSWSRETRVVRSKMIMGNRVELLTSEVMELHSALYYHLWSPHMCSWAQRFAQFIDRMGLLDPTALWDAIPFSFIVDWFANVSSWLSKNKPQLATVYVKDALGCTSMKFTKVYYVRVDNPDKYIVGQNLVQPFADETLYVRFPVKPEIRALGRYAYDKRVGQSPLKFGRAAIASSLLNQQLINRVCSHRRVFPY